VAFLFLYLSKIHASSDNAAGEDELTMK